MNTKQNRALYILSLGIVAVVYSVAVIALFKLKPPAFWSAYTFTMLAILAPLVLNLLLIKKGASPNEIFLSMPYVRTGFIYLPVQFVVGLMIMIVPNFNFTLSIVLQLILFAVFCQQVIAAIMAASTVQNIERKIAVKTFYIKSLTVDIQGFLSRSEDALLKKQLQSLMDAVQYSDAMSHDSLFAIEQKIESQVAEVGNYIETSDVAGAMEMAKSTELLLAERAKKCKILK